MNRHTFKDAVTSKRASLANDLDDDDDDNDRGIHEAEIEGEEDAGDPHGFGEVLEPFNLREERQQGHFDSDMNFVFKKERGEVDSWLANLDEVLMERSIGEAAAAVKKRSIRDKLVKEQVSEEPVKSAAELTVALLGLMHAGETLTGAMKRLSGKKTALPGKRVDKSKASASSGSSEDDKRGMLALIGFADELVARGVANIYELTYEQLDNSRHQWEYQGSEGGDQLHGPFSSEQFASWKQQGYFVGNTAVLIRKAAVHKTDTAASASASAAATAATTTTTSEAAGEWRSSDEIDFGDPATIAILTSTSIPVPPEESEEKGKKAGSKRKRSLADVGRSSSRSAAKELEDDVEDEEADEEKDGEEEDDEEEELNSDQEAENNLRGKRSKGASRTGGRKYTNKDDSDSEDD